MTEVVAEGDHILLSRKDHQPTRFAILKERSVAAAHVEPLLDGEVDFIVNVPREGIFLGDAIAVMENRGVPWGSLADGMRAVRLEFPRTYIPYPYEFVLSGLRRHSRVQSVARLDSRRLRVGRRDGLRELVLYIEGSYQAEVATVNFALDRCSPFDIFVASDPNAGPTDNAKLAAARAGVEILRWRETLGRLNRQ